MGVVSIRQKLADYIKVADDKKVKAMYALLQEEIDAEVVNYTKDVKEELTKRVNSYLKGEQTVSAEAMHQRLKAARKR
jgi:hypothetical protein